MKSIVLKKLSWAKLSLRVKDWCRFRFKRILHYWQVWYKHLAKAHLETWLLKAARTLTLLPKLMIKYCPNYYKLLYKSYRFWGHDLKIKVSYDKIVNNFYIRAQLSMAAVSALTLSIVLNSMLNHEENGSSSYQTWVSFNIKRKSIKTSQSS